MTGDFNPYQQWLGITAAAPPDHYALLGITNSVTDPAEVRRAAVQRKSLVRSCRPGEHATAWGRLLDELDAAQRCLSDPQSRAIYDAELARAIENNGAPVEPETTDGPSHLAPVHNPMPPTWHVTASAATTQQPAAPPAETPRDVPGTQPPLAQPIHERVVSAPLTLPASLIDAPANAQADVPAPKEDKPMAWQYDGSFVVPGAVTPGPAAALLPPAVSFGMQSVATLEAPPLSPPQPPVAPPRNEDHPQPQGKAQVSRRAALRSHSPAPGTIASFAAIGVAILLLAGAIVLLWQTKPDNSLGTSNNSELAKAAVSSAARPSRSQPGEDDAGTIRQPPTNPGPSAPLNDPPASEPPPLNPPMSMPPPVPSPPSAPPQPTPAPPMAPSAEETMRVREALLRTRKMLAERNLSAAATSVKEAEELAGNSELAETTAPTAALTHYVNEFWKAVRSAIPKLAGSEIVIGDTRVFVIEGDGDRVLIRMSGQNREFTIKNMPAGLARKIAESWLEKSPTSKVIVGAFLAVDPTMLANDGRNKARQLWNEAAAGGIDVKDLLRVLNEPQQ